MATTADFKNGMVLKLDNKLVQIIEFQHVKPGKVSIRSHEAEGSSLWQDC